MSLKCTIEAWHQPDGPGYGWAPCSDRKAERFFVFHRGNRYAPNREFKTREEAKRFVLSLKSNAVAKDG